MNPNPPDSCHDLTVHQVSARLEVDVERGLSVDDVQRRRDRFGWNRVTTRSGRPAWLLFLGQFHQPLVYLLLGAAAVTGWLGEWVDASVILSVVLLNAIIGHLQETKATQALEALSRLVRTEANVRRAGQRQRINAEELVPGDIVVLAAGDQIPADLRLFRARGVQTDESALTGESLPVPKSTEALPASTVLAERANQAYAGTLLVSGHAEGLVFATGDATETGRIARLLATTVETSTPLTRKIEQFSRFLLWLILGLAAVTFAVGAARGHDPVQMFMAAVALAVGAIPEGLPAAVTIVLAIGVARMARRGAIIRKLPAVETLGSTTVICSDKTGTLTENQMTVTELWAGARSYQVTGAGYTPEGELREEGRLVDVTTNAALEETLRAGVLCNEAQLMAEGTTWRIQGDPTEAALLVAALKAGVELAEAQRAAPRLDMIPFESAHMFRATLHEHHGRRVIYKVGALERLLDRCTEMLTAEGRLEPLDRAPILQSAQRMADRGLRVLAFARTHPHENHARLEHHHVATGLTFLGLQGMMDPPRPEVIAAIQRCRGAGVRVKMITGDHAATAAAVADHVGLSTRQEAGRVLEGRFLEQLSNEQLPAIAEETAVFARVTPEQKLRLVSALQARGHVVAMTGDGVNDAPALRQADIGVAMGQAGTDVAKGAAAMVLTDDNFTTIEAAVQEGRGVFDNLVKFIVWILPTNLGEALITLTAIFFGLPLPALPLQLLWVNLTDTLLGLPLAFEAKERDVMNRPPRDPRQPLLTFPLIMRTGLVSLIMVAGALGLFVWELNWAGASVAAARTVVVNVIVLVEVIYLFNCRSLFRPVFQLGLRSNPWALVGAGAMLLAQVAFTYLPVMNRLFHSAPLAIEAWLRIGAVTLVVFGAVELEKWIRFGRGRADRALPE